MEEKMTVINAVHDDTPFSYEGVDNRERVVAAYCRVSTDEDEQMNSYGNQIREWTERIKSNPKYTLYKVYGDGGITGTSDKQRPEFQKMIRDAEKGKFDLILCKSISRFARNTILTLSTIRKLKELGVEVYFDNEHMSTFDPKNEFMFTIMSSMAQEESRHISENVRWTFKRKMERGEAFGPGPYGYKISKLGGKAHLVIDPEKASVMKKIFDWFDKGLGISTVIELLHENKIRTAHGYKRWHEDTLLRQLKNPAYKGTLVLQKTYTVDYIGHVRALNVGQRKQYIIENAHKPIVSKEQWERVNDAIKGHYYENAGENVQDVMKYTYKGPLAGLIICGLCNKTYKRRHSYDASYKQPRIIYQCNGYIDKTECGRCKSQGISENILFAAIADMLNNLYATQDHVVDYLKEAFLKRYRLRPLEGEIKKVQTLIEKTKARLKQIRIQQILKEGKENIAQLELEEETLMNNYQKFEQSLQELKVSQSITAIKSNAFSKILDVFGGQKVAYQAMIDFPIPAIVESIKVIDKHNIIIFINATGDYNRVEFRRFIPNANTEGSIFTNTVSIKNPVKKDVITYYVKTI